MSHTKKFPLAEPPKLHFPATSSIHYTCGKCSPSRLPPKGRHHKLKSVTKKGGTAASAGITVAQNTQSGASLSALVFCGTALSTTGIGLVVGGVALAGGASYTAHRSVKSTHVHIDNLNKISRSRSTYKCDAQHGPVHSYIGCTILPYIIQQKRTKLSRKKNQRKPLIGSAYEAGKSFKHLVSKTWHGTKGKQRSFAAQWLAVHMLTHHCELTEAIVAELYSEEEKEWMKLSGSDVVASMIEDKLQTI